MGQQQGKQGVAAAPEPAPPSIIDAGVVKAAPVSRIKGLKPRQSSKESGAWSPALTGGVALGAGPPSGTMLGMFNELSNGKKRIPIFLYFWQDIYFQIRIRIAWKDFVEWCKY